ncbi:MAG: haloacid dehalogenase-like hydrolase [Leptospiraceae bacterium]|nr:haloacid dehalogenase-like hydrolase [Leptospiraceae bacterium]MCP5493494.1 haloacid dehalogenase-like hydrolase [Leptospiraceae bacterium]
MKDCFRQIIIIFLIGFVFLFCDKKKELSFSSDIDVQEIISKIFTTKKAILDFKKEGQALCQKQYDCLFLSFWDFDGTILKGDCSEGLTEDGKAVYKGLLQLSIEDGFSISYNKNEFTKFEKDYREMEAKKGSAIAYQYIAQIYQGQDKKKLETFTSIYFENTLRKFYFSESIKILNSMIGQDDFRVYIISASPDFFVKGASGSLKIPKSQIRGINLEDKDGILTNKIKQPITYAEGKTKALQKIVLDIIKEKKYKNVFVLAGFGNSYQTDAPFLKYIIEQKLPVSKPVAVMINGGKPPIEYDGLFYNTKFLNTKRE